MLCGLVMGVDPVWRPPQARRGGRIWRGRRAVLWTHVQRIPHDKKHE